MVKIQEGQYLAIIGNNRMLEIHAKNKDEAKRIVSGLCDEEFMVCKIPLMIGSVGR